jgi:hypothetical protein
MSTQNEETQAESLPNDESLALPPSEFHESRPDLVHGLSKHEFTEKRTNDPLLYVEKFRTHRTRSVREEVASVVQVCVGLDTIGKENKEGFGRFVWALADAHMMSDAEAAKERDKMPTLSQFRKIHDFHPVILHERVAGKLCTGYSVLYELAKLIEALLPKGVIADYLQIEDTPAGWEVLTTKQA